MTSYFGTAFCGILDIVEETVWLIDILVSWGSFESETCVFHAKLLISKFDLIWIDLEQNSIKSQVWLPHTVKWLAFSISTCKMTLQTCHVDDLYLLVTFCDLTLTLAFYVWPLYHYGTFLRQIRALCGSSNRSKGPKCKNA